MIISYRAHSSTSNIERVFLYKDSGATAGTEGDPFTGLTHDSTGLSISSIANNEATAVTETVAGTDDVETVTTLGTYAAPTAGKVRFREVDGTAHPGLYEIQLADARYAVASAQYLDICISGVADLAACHVRVYLDVLDAAGIRSAVGLASADLDTQLGAIPTVTELDARTKLTADYADTTETQAISEILSEALDGTGPFTANVVEISGDSVAADNAEAFFDGTGYAGTNNVIPTVTTLTGHTAQTGDAFARLGAPAGASVSADVAAVKSDSAAILVDTAEIGAAGAGLTEAGGTGDQLTAVATAAALATAQADLDTLTGTDGVTLATSQPNYAPATNTQVVAAAANVSVDEIQATALADLFNTDSGTTYASAVAGSVVKETADNAGGASLTVQDIVDGVWDEALASHQDVDSMGEALGDAGAAGTPPTVEQIRTEMDDNSTKLAAILADTDEISSIKAKTDSITITVAGKVDSNATHMNGTSITGAGTSGNKWRGA